MNLDNLKPLWQSSANAPTPAETAALKAQFITQLQRRHRRLIAFLVWLFASLTACTGLAIYGLIKSPQAIASGDWAYLPLLLIPWFFTLRFALQFRRHNREHSQPDTSILSALRASLDENRLALARAKRVGLIYLLGIPALALAIYQLRATGKISGHEINSMLTVFGIILSISGSLTAFHYHRHLRPRQTELESLLHHYTTDPR